MASPRDPVESLESQGDFRIEFRRPQGTIHDSEGHLRKMWLGAKWEWDEHKAGTQMARKLVQKTF